MPDLTGREEWEKKMARELGRLLRRTSADILELLGDPPVLANIPLSFWNEIGEEARGVIRKFFRGIYIQAAQEILDAQPIGVDWGLVNEAASDWARQASFDLIKGINETNQKVVRKAVADFYEEQQTLRQLREALVQPFGPVRAELISSTEVTRAAVQGELNVINTLKEEGVEMTSVWVTNRDERVCPICQPLDKQRESPEGGFVPNGEVGPGIPYPPAHPRCRCWLNHEFVLTKETIGA